MALSKRLLSGGDKVVLELPQALRRVNGVKSRNKRQIVLLARIVRFSRNGREMRRLSSGTAVPLAPVSESGLTLATCKVLEGPKSCRIFAEVFLEVALYVK